MKTNKTGKAVAFWICLALLMGAVSSCSNKVYFNTSSIAPAARGYVKIRTDKNENYTIELNISDLAEVERLQGNRKAYVVWMISNGENPKNMGQINSDKKAISKRLSAQFNGVSSSKPTRIFITAEEDGTVQYPGSVEVLTTEPM